MEKLTIRPERPEDEANLIALLDAAFQNRARESQLWSVLRSEHPLFDPELALVATAGDELVGAMLLQPREFLLRGTAISCAVITPVAVAPEFQRRGFGAQMLSACMRGLPARFLAVVLIGDPRYFDRLGYERAFGETLVAYPPRSAEGTAPPPVEWRAIRGEDLDDCRRLYGYGYSAVSGAEVRTLSPLDWDSPQAGSHTVVLPQDGAIQAYLRFRVGDKLRVTECGIASDAGRDLILRFMAQLAAEHHQDLIEVRIPSTHPLFRSLLRRGGRAAIHDFAGACMAWTPDSAALLQKLFAAPHPLPRADSGTHFNLDPGGSPIHVHVRGNRIRCSAGPGKGPTLRVRPGCWMGLLTGLEPPDQAIEHKRGDGREEVLDLLARLLPAIPAMWIAAPVYDLSEG